MANKQAKRAVDPKRAAQVARHLWGAGCVTIKATPSFRWASGLRSPIYTDNRVLLAHPKRRNGITAAFLDLIKTEKLACDVIAGVATSGIPLAAILADHLKKPLVYVRPQAKAHGRGRQVEGELKKGQRVILIEDLVSTGGSSLKAAAALRKAGAELTHVLASFAYLSEQAQQRFAAKGYQLHLLCDGESLLEQGLRQKYIGPRQAQAAVRFFAKLAEQF